MVRMIVVAAVAAAVTEAAWAAPNDAFKQLFSLADRYCKHTATSASGFKQCQAEQSVAITKIIMVMMKAPKDQRPTYSLRYQGCAAQSGIINGAPNFVMAHRCLIGQQ